MMKTMLEEASKKARGTSFVLCMEKDGELTIHPRNSQPCQGGETRKYFSTHGKACTQPENQKPGDLSNPFPEGRVVGIAFPSATFGDYLANLERFKRLRDIVTMSSESPFRSGFSNVSIHEGGVGFSTDTDVDPTVMIQGVQFLRRCTFFFKNMKKEFLEELPDLDFTMLCFPWCNWVSYETGVAIGSYYWQENFSPRRFYEGTPNDLSGGKYGDGYDYNRSFNSHLFVPDMAGEARGLCPSDLKFEGNDVTDRAKQFLDQVHEYMAKEEKPVVEPYKFRTYAGKTYDSHLDYLAEKGLLK